MKKHLLKILVAIPFLCCLAVFVHYYKFRYIPLVASRNYEDISFKDIEGYTDKLSYRLSDTIHISLNAKKQGKGYITKLTNGETVIDSFSVNITKQIFDEGSAENGCNWSVYKSIFLDKNYSPGYYSIEYKSNTESSYSHFIIENRAASKVAILAPVATWVAYNDWGGKSLYKNYFESKTVYYVSSQRPFQSPINKGESNLSSFFIKNYEAALLPDYYLETEVALLKNYDVIILAHHCEYFSEKMYKNLRHLIENEKKSLISLGGNQLYWKTKWDNGFKVMECRKDLTSFSGTTFDYGGMWRHHIYQSEHRLLGVRFTEDGMHSYAPYEVKNPSHWMYRNLNVSQGSVFGRTGVNGLPLSGGETDKIVSLKDNMTLLAKGLNCTGQNNEYTSIDGNCGENPGADFVILENEGYSILSTGSIESGAGLGVDPIFTGMIKNFIEYNTTNTLKQ